MATPRISRSKPTSLHDCAAKACQAGGMIGPNSVYVGCSVPYDGNHLGSFMARRLTITNRYHVKCFVTEFPEIPLDKLKGYERLGEAARDAMQPPRSLWEHLATGEED